MATSGSFLGFLSRVPSRPEVGVSRSLVPGHFEVWATWHPSMGEELLRVVVEAQSTGWHGPLPKASYTFLPSHLESVSRALEASLAFKEFLVGQARAKRGGVQFTFYFHRHEPVSVTLPLEEVVRLYRGRGRQAPDAAPHFPLSAPVDSAELEELPPQELKAKSDTLRQELEEKRRREEEEAKRLAEEKKAAQAAKAAAQKAAADKGGEKAVPAAAVVDKSKPTITSGRVAIFYGSSTGNTAEVAKMLKAELGDAVDHVKNVTEISVLDFGVPQCLILGIPTWHIGELQDDWAALLPDFDKANLDLSNKKVAIFGLGDAKGYPETYVDAMQELWEHFEKKGAKLVGLWPTEGYEFQKSKAIKEGKFLGLVVDVENQDQLTEGRVKEWAQQLRSELL